MVKNKLKRVSLQYNNEIRVTMKIIIILIKKDNLIRKRRTRRKNRNHNDDYDKEKKTEKVVGREIILILSYRYIQGQT